MIAAGRRVKELQYCAAFAVRRSVPGAMPRGLELGLSTNIGFFRYGRCVPQVMACSEASKGPNGRVSNVVRAGGQRSQRSQQADNRDSRWLSSGGRR